jgi:hypothetical protein
VATGLECHWNKIRGLPETLGKDGVTSNYSTDTVETTWKFIREFKGGNAIFTMPSTPIKVSNITNIEFTFKKSCVICNFFFFQFVVSGSGYQSSLFSGRYFY